MNAPPRSRLRVVALVLAAACAPSIAAARPPAQDEPTPAGTATPPTPPEPATKADAPPAAKVDVAGEAKAEAPKVEGAKVEDAVSPPPPARLRDASRPSSTDHEGRFEFGSYGRVWAATDLRGGTGRGTNITAFGPRLVDEGSYAELELRREDAFGPRVKTRIVTTLALFPPFFHFTGKALQNIGLRNLYAQGSYDKLLLWAGSRMYRGDDIYLLNWWPLDNQNTIGGGAGGPVYRSSDGVHQTVAAVHAGQQRLDNPFQFQQIPVVAPYGFGTVDVTKLDRPRTIETLKLTHFVRPNGDQAPGPGFKVILYGELHQISAGTFRDPLIDRDRGLPSDSGFLVGSQLTYWTGERDQYASLVMRHARGIAAYDPLAVPITFALDRSTSGASETQIAASGNFETEHFGVLAAGYVRFFRDASPLETSILQQKYDEGVLVARPTVFLGDHFGVSVEGSYQARRYALLDASGDGPLTAGVFKAGVMPYFSPSGRGSFKRPQIRMLYNASFRDSGARSLYAEQDVFSSRKVEHYLGIGAEWWFNSTAYP